MRARPTLGTPPARASLSKPATSKPAAQPASITHHAEWDAGKEIAWDVWGQHNTLPGLKHMHGGIMGRNAQQARASFEKLNPAYSYLYASPRNRDEREALKWPGLSWLPNWMRVKLGMSVEAGAE